VISKDEHENLRSQSVTSKDGKGGRRYLPFAFTEHGVIMHIDDTNRNLADHAAIINEIITKLNNLIEAPPKPKRKIGFNPEP
jgi:hypothetical protein